MHVWGDCMCVCGVCVVCVCGVCVVCVCGVCVVYGCVHSIYVWAQCILHRMIWITI